MKKIGLVLFVVLGLFGCRQNNEIDKEYIASQIVNYAQQCLQLSMDNSKNIQIETLKIYQKMDDEFNNIVEEDIINEIQVELIGYIEVQLSSYHLPVNITKTLSQEQEVYIFFEDQERKPGKIILRMQDNGQKISYVGVYHQ